MNFRFFLPPVSILLFPFGQPVRRKKERFTNDGICHWGGGGKLNGRNWKGREKKLCLIFVQGWVASSWCRKPFFDSLTICSTRSAISHRCDSTCNSHDELSIQFLINKPHRMYIRRNCSLWRMIRSIIDRSATWKHRKPVNIEKLSSVASPATINCNKRLQVPLSLQNAAVTVRVQYI